MAQTLTQVKNSASVLQLTVGRYLDTGTVAAITFTIGYKPLWVRVANLNASGDAMLEWYHGMADASAILVGIDGARSLITTLGITQLSYGFTLGLQTDVNVTSEQCSWMALG